MVTLYITGPKTSVSLLLLRDLSMWAMSMVPGPAPRPVNPIEVVFNRAARRAMALVLQFRATVVTRDRNEPTRAPRVHPIYVELP